VTKTSKTHRAKVKQNHPEYFLWR